MILNHTGSYTVISIIKTRSAEFGDRFLFIIVKGDVALLFRSMVFDPFCVFLACTLLASRLRSLGGKKFFQNRRGSRVTSKIRVRVRVFSRTETSSPDTLHLRAHPPSRVYTVLSPDVASVNPGCRLCPCLSLPAHEHLLRDRNCVLHLCVLIASNRAR